MSFAVIVFLVLAATAAAFGGLLAWLLARGVFAGRSTQERLGRLEVEMERLSAQAAGEANRGRESSKVLRDCTICAPCHRPMI